MNLRSLGVLAPQAREFGSQLLETIVEALILAFEEHRDLTKRVSIADFIEAQHERRPSYPSDVRGRQALGGD